jgi:hypothetical protein
MACEETAESQNSYKAKPIIKTKSILNENNQKFAALQVILCL